MADFERLQAAVRGGRVAHTAFLDPDAAAQLGARLRDAGVNSQAEGGVTGAQRRVLTALPGAHPRGDDASCRTLCQRRAE